MRIDGTPDEHGPEGIDTTGNAVEDLYLDEPDLPRDSITADDDYGTEPDIEDAVVSDDPYENATQGGVIDRRDYHNEPYEGGDRNRQVVADDSRVVPIGSGAEQKLRLRGFKEDTDETGEFHRPRTGRVVADARRGALMRYELSREEANGPIKIVVSPGLKPPESDTVPVDQEAAESRDADHPTEDEKLWVGFERNDIPPTDDDERASSPQESPLEVTDLLEGYDGPFKLVIEAKGVPPNSQEYQNLLRKVRNDAHNSEIYEAQDVENSIHTTRLQKIAKAAGTALTRVSIAVTAPTESLGYVASLVESVLPASARSSWAAKRVENSSDLIGYSTEHEALDADPEDPAAHVEARDFSDSISYPKVETSGVQQVERQYMSVEQDLPPGERTFRLGERLDNLFDSKGMRRVAGELLLPVKDLLQHTLIWGKSNSGKSEALRQLISNAKVDNYLRRMSGEEIMPLAVVTVDFKKGGKESNFGKVLSDRLVGMGIPEEEATVNRIRPGEGGIRPILDLCDPKHSTPAKQAERIIHSVLIGVSSGTGSGMSGADGETQRILERYVKDGVVAAYEELGWSMNSDVTQYPNGVTPPHPTMALIAHKIREVFDEKSYDDKAKGNLSEFNAGQFENQLKLLPGRFFKDGHPIDFDEVINNPGTTAFEFDELGSNDTARKVATVGLIQEIEKSVDARHAEMGIEAGVGVDEPEVLIVLDEAAAIFDLTPAGQTTSEFLTRLRSKGIAFVISQQLIDGMNPVAFRNIGNFLGLRSLEAQIAAENKLFGDATAESLSYMNSKEVQVNRGYGLAYVAGVNGPVRWRTARTSDLPQGEGSIENAADLVSVGSYRRHYSGEVIGRASEFLDTKRAGNLITAWAEVSAGLLMSGREMPQITGLFKKALAEMRDTEMRDTAIVKAVCNAVDARHAALYVPAGPDAMKDYMIDKMLTQARGGKVADIDLRFEFCLDHGYYSRVRDVIENALIADKLDNTAEFEVFLNKTSNEIIGGDGEQDFKINGATAAEQKSNLERLERESVKAVRDVVVAGEKRAPVRSEVQRAQLALARLIGTPNSTDGAAYVLEKLKLTHEQVKVFEQLLATMPAEKLEARRAGELSILAMHRALEKAIKVKEDTAPAVPLQQWSRVYKGQSFEVPSKLAKDQLKLIEDLERKKLEKCDYRDEVEMVDNIIAYDLRNGGLALDNAVAALAARQQIQGKLYARARRVLNDGKEEQLTIVEQAKNLKVDDWAAVIGREILYGKVRNFHYTKAAKRFMVGQVNRHVRELRQMAQKRRQKQQPSSSTQAA